MYICGMEHTFRIRFYGRTELAQMYCPAIKDQSAYRKFRAWLMLNPRLRHLCNEDHPRSFTPKEVKLIVDELGEP